MAADNGTRRKPRTAPRSPDLERLHRALAENIAQHLARTGMTQTEASYVMRDAPSQISLVATGKLRGFSVERLLRMNARLGYDVDVVLREAAGRKGRMRCLRRTATA
jgi:predicted XRE-type DNA-binding protein